MEDFLDQVLPHMDFDFASGWEDISCNSGPLVSIDFFRNVVVPRYNRISKKLRAAGIGLWYTDCDGDIRPLLPYFLEGGINCMFPFEVNGCSHPSELLNEYGKELRIMGGVDKMKLREGKEAIKSYLETLVPLVERGGYIPHVDHRCPPDVSPENYLYSAAALNIALQLDTGLLTGHLVPHTLQTLSCLSSLVLSQSSLTPVLLHKGQVPLQF